MFQRDAFNTSLTVVPTGKEIPVPRSIYLSAEIEKICFFDSHFFVFIFTRFSLYAYFSCSSIGR